MTAFIHERAMFVDHVLLPTGWARDVRLTLAGGKIASLQMDVVPEPGDEHHKVMLPGMPNLHSHAFQRAMAGLTERRGHNHSGAMIDDSFWSWRELMYRFALTMSPDDVEAVAAQLYVEMLEAGFTRVGEFHYLHHAPDGQPYANLAEMAERIASAANQAGIGLTLLPVFYAHSGFGGQAPTDGQRRFTHDIARYEVMLEASRRIISDQPGAVLGIAPHSLRAVTPDELAALLPMAKGGPIHLHIAEQVKEVEDCLTSLKARPVAWLLDHMPVDERWCLIHATHMSADETMRLARTGAVAGLCPITEANLGDGIFNGPDFTGAGGRFGIGSDSNVEISLGGELRMLEYSQRLKHRARNVMGGVYSTGRSLFDRALQGGAQALQGGSDASVPGLMPGAVADMITLTPVHDAWEMPSGDALLDALVFAPGTVQVESVFVRGVQVVEGGRHRHREAIAKRFGAVMKKLTA